MTVVDVEKIKAEKLVQTLKWFGLDIREVNGYSSVEVKVQRRHRAKVRE